jgi:hypothetical protein
VAVPSAASPSTSSSGYIFNNEKAIAKRADFISLTDAQLRKARRRFTVALKGWAAGSGEGRGATTPATRKRAKAPATEVSRRV